MTRSAAALPRPTERARLAVARVLDAAANAGSKNEQGAVLGAMSAIGDVSERADIQRAAVGATDTNRARQLNAAARDAFWTRDNAQEALQLQTQALQANPSDAEIAGNLAFYHLKVTPRQPEVARQLALHALAMAASRSSSTRQQDWATLASASALTGREADATNALYVFLALSKDLDRTCRAAVAGYTNYGESLKAPVEAMLRRVASQGGASVPQCSAPWQTAGLTARANR